MVVRKPNGYIDEAIWERWQLELIGNIEKEVGIFDEYRERWATY